VEGVELFLELPVLGKVFLVLGAILSDSLLDSALELGLQICHFFDLLDYIVAILEQLVIF
jgi:hypothetical protein